MSILRMADLDLSGTRVLIPGHPGFTGAWAARWLAGQGARVTGLALPPLPGPCPS